MAHEILLIVVLALLTRFLVAPVLIRAVPRRFTVRFALLLTTALAIFLAAYMALAPY